MPIDEATARVINDLVARIGRLELLHRGDAQCWRYHHHPGYAIDNESAPLTPEETHMRQLRDAAVWGGNPCQTK